MGAGYDGTEAQVIVIVKLSWVVRAKGVWVGVSSGNHVYEQDSSVTSKLEQVNACAGDILKDAESTSITFGVI